MNPKYSQWAIDNYLFGFVKSRKGNEIIVDPDKQGLRNEYVNYLDTNRDKEFGVFVGLNGEKIPFDSKIRAMIFDKEILLEDPGEESRIKAQSNLRFKQLIERFRHAQSRIKKEKIEKPSGVMGYDGRDRSEETKDLGIKR